VRKAIAGFTLAVGLAVPASGAEGKGPGECFLPPGNAQSNVAKARGDPNEFWQEAFGFRNLGEAVHEFCRVASPG